MPCSHVSRDDAVEWHKPDNILRVSLLRIFLFHYWSTFIDGLFSNSPTIFQNTLGMTREMGLLLSGINGIEYWLSTFIPIPLVDRLGRRSMFLFAAIGQCISMAVLAGTIAYPDDKAAGYCAAVFLFVFNTVSGIGFQGNSFLLPVELTPLQTRGKSVSIATGIFWLCSKCQLHIDIVKLGFLTIYRLLRGDDIASADQQDSMGNLYIMDWHQPLLYPHDLLS